MKSIIADVTTRAQSDGGLPWGLWHDLCLSLAREGSTTKFRVSVRDVEQHGPMGEGTTHVVWFDFAEQTPDNGSVDIGSSFEVYFEKWLYCDAAWQDQKPVADGVVTGRLG